MFSTGQLIFAILFAISFTIIIFFAYKKDNKTVGVLGVIGPKRMNYQRIVEIVDFTAKIFSKK